MLNILWPAFITLSVIYAIIFGKVEELNESIMNSLSN